MSKFVKLINEQGKEFLYHFESGWGVSNDENGRAVVINDIQERQVYVDMTYSEIKNAFIMAHLL